MLTFGNDEFNQIIFPDRCNLKQFQPNHNTLKIHVQYFTNKYCACVVQKHFNNLLAICKLECKNVYNIGSKKCQVVRQRLWLLMWPMIPQCHNKCAQRQKNWFDTYPFKKVNFVYWQCEINVFSTTYNLQQKDTKAININLVTELTKGCIFWSQISPVWTW